MGKVLKFEYFRIFFTFWRFRICCNKRSKHELLVVFCVSVLIYIDIDVQSCFLVGFGVLVHLSFQVGLDLILD